jgi:hypothetical protein
MRKEKSLSEEEIFPEKAYLLETKKAAKEKAAVPRQGKDTTNIIN